MFTAAFEVPRADEQTVGFPKWTPLEYIKCKLPHCFSAGVAFMVIRQGLVVSEGEALASNEHQ